MKKILFLLLLISFPGFIFAQSNSTLTPTEICQGTSPLSPDSWKCFYTVIRPAADVKCLTGNTTFEKISNCIITVTKALRYLAVILFVLGLTYVAGLLVFAPFKKDAINQAKTILIWIIVGFIILFIAEKIMEAIKQLVT